MSGRTEWMIYGANGYTGRLVAAEARRRNLKPVLAGRRAGPIEKLAAELGLPVRVFGLDDATAAAAAIADMAVVANCAGPFAATSAPMIDACLTSRAHYLDITGEIDVFLAAQRRHADAQAAGIVICPGVGFDVIPTDCMAAMLKEALPDATHLVLAFDARGPMSPGTARTMVQSLRLGKHGSRVRRNGVLEEVPLAQSWRNIDFAGGSATAMAIPWGDLATAWFSTGIPNIETYAAVPRAAAIANRALNLVRSLLKSAPGQALLYRLANRANGPSEEQLRTGRSPSVGRCAQCGRRAAHSEAGDCQRVSPDGRRNDYGGAMPADKCPARWVLHAEHAPGRALRRTIARVDFHLRGVAARSR
jgi:short subunit dehydrogenase-like uncharacterized protein